MSTYMRQPTLDTLGLGTVLDIFRKGHMPATAEGLVDRVFGPKSDRGCLVISGINGIVGAGKAMQLGSRLDPYGITIVGLDFPGAPDGLGKQYRGLKQSFGPKTADRIMSNVVRLAYNGKELPATLKGLKPKFVLEAIPEILPVKRAHYELFRSQYPGIEIRSVTSGFPSSELGVGVAHPAFPHEINKMWETVEPSPSAITQLLWALGLTPVPVADRWSFVLDVLFCGATLAALRYHEASNMPFWKVDKYVRRLLGPNPFRAHDAIGAKGANFLTWSCLHHLSEHYGELFAPTADLVEHKTNGVDWYPPNHFRPIVNWNMQNGDEEVFRTWLLGPIYQMTSLLLHEQRGHFSHLNSIGELCAQFRKGVLAQVRGQGADAVVRTVEAYHRLHPAASKNWYPHEFDHMDSADWQQLYVNAEHDGKVGVITISRESYNSDVDKELNRAIDWLKAAKIERVIVTGDFHLSTQMVGADTSEFFGALDKVEEGYRVSANWSKTARRLHEEFAVSVGFIAGKRCLGGMLELLMHCHYLAAVDSAQVGMPEVTLPVVPGMEGCHWSFRKAASNHWPRLLTMLLSGASVKAPDAVGWLLDYAGPMDDAVQMCWKLASGEKTSIAPRKLVDTPLATLPQDGFLPPAETAEGEAARKAVMDTIQASTKVSLAEAIEVQAKHSANFMICPLCKKGRVGQEYTRVMAV